MMSDEEKRRPHAVLKKVLDVIHLKKSKEEASRFLNQGQCLELEDLEDRLEHFGNRRETWDLDIQKVGSLHRLRHTGTSLGSISADVFFGHVEDRLEIVVLGTYPSSDSVPPHLLARLENRLEHYMRLCK